MANIDKEHRRRVIYDMSKHGRIAFITTPESRSISAHAIGDFVYQNIYFLCRYFEVLATGRTYKFIMDQIARQPGQADCEHIATSIRVGSVDDAILGHWRETVKHGLVERPTGVRGMVELAHDLVEGRLDAVIHLSNWGEVVGKPDSMVLRREANVHNVPIASDIPTAKAAIRTWESHLAKSPASGIFAKRTGPKELPLEGITRGDKVLALIAHDGMKLEICCFMVEYARKIFDDFDYILATGTTGKWLKRFVLAAGYSRQEAERIRTCLSGPYGGDVQIAAAVVKRLCQKVIFLQDPFTSHAHENDIRLFEQSVMLFEQTLASPEIEVEFATNLESAKVVIGL